MSHKQRLSAAVLLTELPQLAAAVCAHLGSAFDPAGAACEERVTTELRQSGQFTVTVRRVDWTDGVVMVSTQGESGDNGGTDSRVWEGWFCAEASITGLPGGVALRFTGDGWGGHTVDAVAVEGASSAPLVAWINAWREAR